MASYIDFCGKGLGFVFPLIALTVGMGVGYLIRWIAEQG